MSGFSLKGEIRGVKDREFSYRDQNGAPQSGREVSIAVETDGCEVVEVKLSRDQIAARLHESFAGQRGKVMHLPVEVYVKKGYLNVLLSRSFSFPAAAAPAPAAAGGVK